MQPDVPLGNLEPSVLARFIVDDFRVAWDAMSTCSAEAAVGGNFMFARQALGYLELASRTASRSPECLARFAQFLGDREPRYK